MALSLMAATCIRPRSISSGAMDWPVLEWSHTHSTWRTIVQDSQPHSTNGDTAPSRSSSDPLSERLTAFTRDPFEGYFEGRSVAELVPPGSLLDTANTRRWFELFAAGLPHSLYTYQLPLSQASGPDTSVLESPLVLFSSYSYLGLIGHPRLATAVKE